MSHASARSLVILSALFWYGGGVVLLIKGAGLIKTALQMDSGTFWPGVVLVSGVVIGLVKARYLFARSCRKNVSRINALAQPMWWQFFRPGFFIFLVLMMTAGTTLSHLSQGNYPFLLAVAVLDFSVAVGLLGSSYVYWVNGHAPSRATTSEK
jgi:hypothetical protein